MKTKTNKKCKNLVVIFAIIFALVTALMVLCANDAYSEGYKSSSSLQGIKTNAKENVADNNDIKAGVTVPLETKEDSFVTNGGIITGLTDAFANEAKLNNGGNIAIKIPNIINSIPITEIGTDAFKFTDPNTGEYKGCTLVALDLSGAANLTTIASRAFLATSITSLNFTGASKLTTIGNQAFQDCSNLQSINFTGASKLTTISNNTFWNCGNLQSVDFTGTTSLTTIDNYAFVGCFMLGTIDFTGATSLTTIGNYAFQGCSNLQTVNFTKMTNLTTICDGAFQDCSLLSSINFSGMTNLSIIGNNAFLNCFGSKTINFTGATSLTTIGDSAFESCGNLQSVDFTGASKLTTIGKSAFDNCASLQSVDFTGATDLTTIGSSAFYNCMNLQSINFTEATGLTTIGNQAFECCGILSSINFSGMTNLSTIGNQAFQDCQNLQSVDFTGATGLTTIGNSAFSSCGSLKTVNFTGMTNLSTIGNNAFQDCGILLSINFSGMTNLSTIGNNAFIGCYGLKTVNFTGASKLTTIGNKAFINCGNLQSVDFTGATSLAAIGNYAFSSCRNLQSVDFTGVTSLTTIGDDAFYRCGSLQSVDFTEATKLKTIGNSAFQYCDLLSSINFSKMTSLTTIGTRAFISTRLGGILTIPESVRTIGAEAFMNTSIEQVEFLQKTALTNNLEPNIFFGCNNLKCIIVQSVDVYNSYSDSSHNLYAYKDKLIYKISVQFDANGYSEVVSSSQEFLYNKPLNFQKNATTGLWENNVNFKLPKPNTAKVGYILDWYKDSAKTEKIDTNQIVQQGSYYAGFSECLAHVYVFTKTIPPTCSEQGYDIETCTKCGNIRKTPFGNIDPNAHDWNDVGVITKKATIDSDGEMTYTCNHNHKHTRVEAIKLFVKESSDETKKASVKDAVEEFFKEKQFNGLYDIKLLLGDVYIAPDEMVTIRIAVPESLKDASNIVVLMIKDGKWTAVTAEISEGHIVFDTDSITEFALISDITNGGVKNLFVDLLWLWILLIVLLIAIAVVLCWYFIPFEIVYMRGEYKQADGTKYRCLKKVIISKQLCQENGFSAQIWYLDKALTKECTQLRMPPHKVTLYTNGIDWTKKSN